MKKLLLAIITVCFAFKAQAAEPLKVTYGLYASGFNVVEIEGTYTVNDGTYDLTMDLKTAGLLGKLAPWSGALKTNGIYKKSESTPLHHSFASTWRDETETKSFTFNDDGLLIKAVKKEGNKTDNAMPAKDVYAGGALDTLTALFQAMNKPSCAGTYDVMDGKRRFDMVFKSKGIKTLEPSRYTMFDGEAEKCEVEIVPTTGKWRDKKRGWMSIQDQAKGNGHLPTLWFAKLKDNFPPVPVRFLIKTNYGAMVMHVTAIE